MSRYNRQVRLEGFGKEAQEKLSKTRVIIIGAGGLGCPVLSYLTAAGAGTIGIIDHDTIDESNLQRQPLYATADIGRAKVDVASERGRALNPDTEFITWKEKISPENALDIIKDFHLVLDCTDNYEARYLINDACVILNKPWIYGAVEAWNGQLAVFNYNSSATYRCIFPEAPDEILNCNDVGVIGTVPGTVGIMQANEAIKLITGIGTVQTGLLLIDLLHNKFQTIKIKRNESAVNQITAIKKDYSRTCEIVTPLEISFDDFFQNPGKFTVIDIRDEFEIDFPFSYTNLNLPVHELVSGNFTFVPEKNYLLVCANGMRSMVAAKKMTESYPGCSFRSLTGGVSKINLMK
jgi:sulfur-carrier protein adenylyltransferase/sulfurtransferase